MKATALRMAEAVMGTPFEAGGTPACMGSLASLGMTEFRRAAGFLVTFAPQTLQHTGREWTLRG
jgi:hypothetical protein